MQVTRPSVVVVLCLAGFVSGCAMSEETSLVGALNADAPVVQLAAAEASGEPAQASETATSQVAGARAPGLLDDAARDQTMDHLRALALANRKRQGASLSSSVAELERLQATHGDAALSEIADGNAPQN